MNPLPHQLLERPFSTHQTPAIRLHGVILRHPPPSGCELWLNSPDLDAFSLFPPTSRHYHQNWHEGRRSLREWAVIERLLIATLLCFVELCYFLYILSHNSFDLYTLRG